MKTKNKYLIPRLSLSLIAVLSFLAACAPKPHRQAAIESKPTEFSLPPTSTEQPEIQPSSTPTVPALMAGLRASSYGIQPFPDPDWWGRSSQSMANRFPGAQPSVIWIVGVVGEQGEIWLNFPQETNSRDPYLRFEDTDSNQTYLDNFDQQGIKVWLQVEPGQADVTELIDVVLGRFAHHPCVIGFGIDVEWYRQDEFNEGKAVTDEEAATWSKQIQGYNPEYILFLKHWLPEKMPPSYRQGIVFVDDSQELETLAQMSDEFEAWGQYFYPAAVAFQYGYESDQPWWGQLSDPPADIGNELISRIPNLEGLYWVDFTALQIWPDG